MEGELWALVFVYLGRFIEVDIFPSEEDAQNAFMRDLYEDKEDFVLPAKYDPPAIKEFLASIGESYIWKIEQVR